MRRVVCILSSRCIGYQIEDGAICASVHSGIVQLDNGETALRYWVSGSVGYVEREPRIDRPMAERPRAAQGAV